MSKPSKKPARLSAGSALDGLHRQASLDNFFTRLPPKLSSSPQSSQGHKPDTSGRATASKGQRPIRLSHTPQVAASSSVTPIKDPARSLRKSYSVDVPAPSDALLATRSSSAGGIKSTTRTSQKAANASAIATLSRSRSSTTRSQPKKTTVSPQRVTQKTVMKSSSKRKYQSDEGSYVEPAREDPHVGSALPPALHASSALSSLSSGPFTPKDNVPSPRSRDSTSRKPSLPKKARICSLDATVEPPNVANGKDVEEEFIPSSQSDEQELTVPRYVQKDPAEVIEIVDKWRQEAIAHPPSPVSLDLLLDSEFTQIPPEDESMDVDSVMMGPPSRLPAADSAPHSETEVSVVLRGRGSQSTLSSVFPTAEHTVSTMPPVPTSFTPSRVIFRPLTPPPLSELPPGPSTPVALNTESKTAKIIAEIKAQAYAAVASSPDEPLEYEDLESSSSSDSDDHPFARKSNADKWKAVATPKGKTRVPSSSPLTNVNSSPASKHCSSRYDLRHRPPIESSSSSDEKKPVFYAKPAAKGKRRATNPLEALLKDKRLADKRGKGISALRAAEATVASTSQQAKFDLRSEMDDEEDSESEAPWANEDAALQIVQRDMRRLPPKSSSPIPTTQASDESDDDAGSDEEALQEEDCERILGAKGGKAVGRILANDRRSNLSNAKVKRKHRVLGIPLWEDSLPEAEDTDNRMRAGSLPSLPFSEEILNGYPILSSLSAALHRNDIAFVTMVIGSGYLTVLEPEHAVSMSSWLFDLALAPIETQLSEPAYQALISYYSVDTATGISWNSVLSTLVAVGASLSTLEAQGWTVGHVQCEPIEPTRREDLLDRLVTVLTICAEHSALSVLNIPDMMLALCLVALDPLTSADLQEKIMVAIDYLGRASGSDSESPSASEISACAKILKFASGLSAINRAHLMSLMIGGSLQTSRMARWISRSLLIDSTTATQESYCDLPSFAPIIALLSPISGSEGLFDIVGNSDKDDYYEDLTCYASILSRALTNIDGYAAEEKKAAALAAAQASSSRDGAGREKPPGPLEQLKTLLDGIHGKIVDTRAAHLDRSRAKAALQRLAFRVHYQRVAAQRSGGGTGKPRNLRSYFASPSR